jgi:hypothetical protein
MSDKLNTAIAVIGIDIGKTPRQPAPNQSPMPGGATGSYIRRS